MTTSSKKKTKTVSSSASQGTTTKSNTKDFKKKLAKNFQGGNKATSSSNTSLISLNSQEEKEDEKDDSHSIYAIGVFIVVKYRDGSHRVAKIIHRSKVTTANENDLKLYVHYNDFNRRMDEWVDLSRVISLASPEQCITNHGHGHGLNSQLTPSQSHDDDHPSMDVHVPVTTSSSVTTISTSQKVESISISTTTQDKTSLSSSSTTNNLITTVADLDHDEHEGMDANALLEHEEITKIKNIQHVLFGPYIMECWYFSPFPEEFYNKDMIDYLYFCEFSFRFFKTKNELIRYQSQINLLRHPPGNEIYRDNHVSMFEIDGMVEKFYCQNLCYFAKLFLDHKTLYWDVDPFLFYVLCTYDKKGFHPVGFFSKEKYSDLGYNLACILTFPSSQRKGYGRFLIQFSYELSKKEEKVGSPEKPLSDLGAVSYKSYWASTILSVLHSYSGTSISILDITRVTSILVEDVTATLMMLGLLVRDESEDDPAAVSVDNGLSTTIQQASTTTTTTTTTSTTTITASTSNSNFQSSSGGNTTLLNASSSSSSGNVNKDGTNTTQIQAPLGKFMLICPPDIISQAMKKYPPGQLVASTILSVLHSYSGTSISILDITRVTSILVEDVTATLMMLGLLVRDESEDDPAAVSVDNGLSTTIQQASTTTTTTTTTSTTTITASTSNSNFQSSSGGNTTLLNASSSSSSGNVNKDGTNTTQIQAPLGKFMLICPPDIISQAMKKYPPGQLVVDPSRLHWAPLYVMDPKKDKWSIKCYTGMNINI